MTRVCRLYNISSHYHACVDLVDSTASLLCDVRVCVRNTIKFENRTGQNRTEKQMKRSVSVFFFFLLYRKILKNIERMNVRERKKNEKHKHIRKHDTHDQASACCP